MDRIALVASAAIGVGPNLYALLPASTAIRLLPFPGALTFCAPMPALDGALTNEAYVVGAFAATTAVRAARVRGRRVRVTNGARHARRLPPSATLVSPARPRSPARTVDRRIEAHTISRRSSSRPGGGMSSWTIIAPAGKTSFDLPDLAALPDDVGLKRGPIVSTVYIARLDASFSYGALRSGDLTPGKWTAYAWDALGGSY
ncbi:MAG: hypothetical protein U0235_33905 [Polyangiaceae bacterium]